MCAVVALRDGQRIENSGKNVSGAIATGLARKILCFVRRVFVPGFHRHQIANGILHREIKR
jgi:hypothetical protein